MLDELGVERAHFVGRSYGGRLAFGIGEHAPARVLSLVAGGQQPYAVDPNGPLARVIYLGAGDVDFIEQARRAAGEIPNAEFVALDDLDHYGAHFEAERVVPAVLRTLRENS